MYKSRVHPRKVSRVLQDLGAVLTEQVKPTLRHDVHAYISVVEMLRWKVDVVC